MFENLYQSILGLDVKLFHLINHRMQNPIFDCLMPIITNIKYWRIPLLILWLALIIRGGRKGRTVAVMALITLILTDRLNSAFIKPIFGRSRPCNELQQIRLLISASLPGGLSFPSTHAANIFAQALVFAYKYRRIAIYLFVIACVVGYSRVYVGAHYPLDVLAGAIVGLCIASAVIGLEKIYMHKKPNK